MRSNLELSQGIGIHRFGLTAEPSVRRSGKRRAGQLARLRGLDHSPEKIDGAFALTELEEIFDVVDEPKLRP